MRQGIRVVASIVVIALMGVEAAGGGVCLDWRKVADRYARPVRQVAERLWEI